ncbi:glycoside hydrolase family 15 protein [Amnibacterium kyonggiense]
MPTTPLLLPPHVLREYAVIADGERGAVIGPRGDVVWMCAPAWDSPAVFAALLGGESAYVVRPEDDAFVWGGSYEPGSLIWRSRWVTRATALECREALAFPGDARTAVLLRRVVALDQDVRVEVALAPRADFGRAPARATLHDGVWTIETGGLVLRWTGASHARVDEDGVLRCSLTVPAGGSHDLVLECSDRALGAPRSADELWSATERAWADAIPAVSGTVADRDARHGLAVLRGLTSASGGMVAAATTSLPERADSGRNYDYRYAWIRDQCFAGQAAAAAGADDLLDDAVRFVSARLLEHGPDLKPAYRVDGGAVPDQHAAGLPGYPGGGDVLGNHVNEQFQLDAFGEALLLLAAAERVDRLGEDGRRAAAVAADAIAARWQEPDAGIWEIAPKRWTHSALTCVAGLRAVASSGPGGRAERAGWSDLADTLLTTTTGTSLHPSGAWQRAPEDARVDGALLLPPIRGALAADDPRTVRTLDRVLQDLGREEYLYRFHQDERPLGEAEGAFLLCGFAASLALHQQGRRVEAARWFERNRAACGAPGLITEEYDVRQRQLRGNLPQAFVHALLVEAAVRLAD